MSYEYVSNRPVCHLSHLFSVLPEDKDLALTGRVRLVHGYGPPGWGEDKEHDAHIVYWVIDLPSPINTPCTVERPELAEAECQSTKRLRLIVEGDEGLRVKARAAQGREAIVRGTLHRQDTAGEITPIYLQVVDISLAR
jgi:hypothetical protein